MKRTNATALTVVEQSSRRERRRHFTDVSYDLTWNTLTVTFPGGVSQQFDRLNIIHIQASNNHAAPVAA